MLALTYQQLILLPDRVPHPRRRIPRRQKRRSAPSQGLPELKSAAQPLPLRRRQLVVM
jgi:hypothetical protein